MRFSRISSFTEREGWQRSAQTPFFNSPKVDGFDSAEAKINPPIAIVPVTGCLFVFGISPVSAGESPAVVVYSQAVTAPRPSGRGHGPAAHQYERRRERSVSWNRQLGSRLQQGAKDAGYCSPGTGVASRKPAVPAGERPSVLQLHCWKTRPSFFGRGPLLRSSLTNLQVHERNCGTATEFGPSP